MNAAHSPEPHVRKRFHLAVCALVRRPVIWMRRPDRISVADLLLTLAGVVAAIVGAVVAVKIIVDLLSRAPCPQCARPLARDVGACPECGVALVWPC